MLLLAAMSPLLAGAASAPAKCKLMTVAQIPVDLRSGRPVISAAIDGHASNMLVDTGASQSLIFRSAAAAFGLKVVENGRAGYAAGGIEYSGTVEVHDLDVAGFVVHHLILAAMGHGAPSDKVAGVLGEDFLAHWDLELDPAAGVMRLMVPKDCTGDQVVYWAPAYSVVSLDPSWWHALQTNVQLNGHDVLAMFDTGASNTIVGSDVVKRPGLHPTVAAATGKLGHGLASGGFAMDTAVFPSITIGQETIQNPKLVVADLFSKTREVKVESHIASKPENQPEMLIGMDFFRAHHVYVARDQKKMFFTYLGGPIFLTADQAAAKAPPAAPAAEATPGAAAPRPVQTPDPATPPVETPKPAAPQ